MTSAKVIADSISDEGKRITTLEVVMHRFVLAEMNTHRVFSRNSASSRAIPVHKIMDRVESSPAYPVEWTKEQKGMQGGETFVDVTEHKKLWDKARETALSCAKGLVDLKLHKSLTNRLLEPFMWHTAIITATEWDNFFHQRCDPAAQPEMKAVADEMQLAYFCSTPQPLSHGEWHLPYINKGDWEDISELYPRVSSLDLTQKMKQISVARCARVSYLTQDGVRDPLEDLNLFDRLLGNNHWSPFEHVATPTKGNPVSSREGSDVIYYGCGNFIGWKQFRKTFRDENRTKFLPNLAVLAQQRMRMESGLTPYKGDK